MSTDSTLFLYLPNSFDRSSPRAHTTRTLGTASRNPFTNACYALSEATMNFYDIALAGDFPVRTAHDGRVLGIVSRTSSSLLARCLSSLACSRDRRETRTRLTSGLTGNRRSDYPRRAEIERSCGNERVRFREGKRTEKDPRERHGGGNLPCENTVRIYFERRFKSRSLFRDTAREIARPRFR